jgi:two-component system sensor histidine kinase/response regulator
MMAGEHWVDSAEGAGSVFHFTASFGMAPAPVMAARAMPPPQLPVLIVDDNAASRCILQEQVARWGMIGTAVTGGAAAADALTAAAAAGAPFGLVILDSRMPERDGFWVAEHIAAHPELTVPTIMMLNPSDHYGDAARCRALHVSAHLLKPIDSAELLDVACLVLRPTVNVPAALPEGTPMPAAARAGGGLRILLAEDNAVNQLVAVKMLTRRGHTVTVANTGREALGALERDTFDLVLMDVQMPDMSGLEATIAIRLGEQTSGAHQRIVAMTAHAMSGDRERCVAAGMDSYLSKPIDPQLLFAMVEQEPA